MQQTTCGRGSGFLYCFIAGTSLAFAATSTKAMADDQAPEWHGFFTSGVMFSDSGQSYDGGITRTANIQSLTHLGLNITKHLDERWDVAAQVVADSTNISPDWVFVSWYPVRGLTLRVGKQKAPIWLISDHIDVGHTYPWVAPPEEVYSLNPIREISGLGGAYRLPIGAYELTFEAVGSGHSTEAYSQPGFGGAPQKVGLEIRRLVVANLAFGTDKMQIRGAYASGDVGVITDYYAVNSLHATFDEVGLKVDTNGFLLLAEYASNQGSVAQSEIDAAAANAGATAMKAAQTGSAADIDAARAAGIEYTAINGNLVGGRAWYGTVGYQLHDALPFATYARLKSPAGSTLRGSQDSATFGCKIDMNLLTDIKLEGQHVWPKDRTQGLIDLGPSGGSNFEQLNVFKAAVDVAF